MQEKQSEKKPRHAACRVTTLCHLEQDGKYLMLHRISKKVDENKDKWIGVGGHVEEGESPEDCLIREVFEETGLTLTSYRFRGLVTFVSDQWGTEYMCLYTADSWTGEMTQCSEGTLEWIEKEKVCSLNIWEGDKIFFRLLAEDAPWFSLKLCYEGDRLVEAVLDGKPLELFDIRTPDGKVTGIVRERSVAHMDGSLHGTSHIWVVRETDDGKFDVLLQKRSMMKDGFPGYYDTSSAGHVPAGEDFPESACRELREELGIQASEDQLHFMGMYEYTDDAVFHGRRFYNRELSAVYVYMEPIDDGQITIQEEEIESVMWLDLDQCLEQVKRGTLKHCMNEKELQDLRRFCRNRLKSQENMKTERVHRKQQAKEHHVHDFQPVFDEKSEILILGTFPSVKSREYGFYYGHKQNRFWRVLAAITGSEIPETIEEKKKMLLDHKIAVWDVIASCDIAGSSDSSITNVKPAEIETILENAPIKRIYANGATAKKLYDQYQKDRCRMEIIPLPSTSPANAAWSLEKLIKEWKNQINLTKNLEL